MAETSFLTGQLARRAGVTPYTLRYYERRGLLPAPSRAPNGYRRYAASAVKVIRFIKRAQELGFTLSEVEEFLAIAGNPRAKCTGVCSAIELKLDGLKERVRELQSKKTRLQKLLAACPGDVPIRECPIVGALTGVEGATRTRRRTPR